MPYSTASDEEQIRAPYQRMLNTWLDAQQYAQCFAPGAHYVTGGRKLERGQKEIVDGHEIIFSAGPAIAISKAGLTGSAS